MDSEPAAEKDEARPGDGLPVMDTESAAQRCGARPDDAHPMIDSESDAQRRGVRPDDAQPMVDSESAAEKRRARPDDASPMTAPESAAAGQLPGWVSRSQQVARRRYRMGLLRPLLAAGILALIAVLGWIFWFSLPNPARWFVGSPSGNASSASQPGQWSMLGYGPAINGYAPNVPQQPAGRLRWSQDLGPATRSAPLAAGGLVYVGGHFKIIALDADTGAIRWSVDTPGPVDHALTIANIAGNGKAGTNIANGAGTAIANTPGDSAAGGNLVYVGQTDHRLLALNGATGAVVWQFKAHLPIAAAALVDGGIAYITSAGNIIYALDARTGELLWRHQIRGNVKTTPAVRDGRLYAADDEGNLYFIDADNGRRRFRFITAGSASGPPVAADGAVYFPSGGALYAIDTGVKGLPGLYWLKRAWFQLWIWQVPLVPPPPAQRGEMWRFAPEERASLGVIASPAVAEGIYYLGDGDGIFYARDATTDAEIWRYNAGAGIVSSPIILRDKVYFGARNGILYALNRANGAPIWTLNLGAPIELPPAYANGRLYIRTADGRLHAVE